MKDDSKILICYNSPVSIFSIYNGKPEDIDTGSDDLSETSFLNEIKTIEKSLRKYFKNVSSFAIDRNVKRTTAKLSKADPDVIFNFVESVEGISLYESFNAGLFELLGLEYTGNKPQCLGNCLNKYKAKLILSSYGVNTPKAFIVKKEENADLENISVGFPVILKLLTEDASIGISEYSVVKNETELKKQLSFLKATYNQDVIIEEYIDGRELNVAILGEEVLPISEIKFDGLPENLPKIVTYDGKWLSQSLYYENTVPKCPAIIDDELKQKITETALTSFKAMGCRDYARVDIRLNREGTPYVIEVNPNPDISTDSGFARAATATGLTHPELLNTIAKFALKRKEDVAQIKVG
jgi:D-alanine-D-alanine ligase